jgi:hypothetical protein
MVESRHTENRGESLIEPRTVSLWSSGRIVVKQEVCPCHRSQLVKSRVTRRAVAWIFAGVKFGLMAGGGSPFFWLYGPTEAYSDKSWLLPDIERCNNHERRTIMKRIMRSRMSSTTSTAAQIFPTTRSTNG